MEVQKVIRKIHKLKAENSTLEYRLQAAQEYIDKLKRQRSGYLLIGISIGLIFREVITWAIKFFQQL